MDIIKMQKLIRNLFIFFSLIAVLIPLISADVNIPAPAETSQTFYANTSQVIIGTLDEGITNSTYYADMIYYTVSEEGGTAPSLDVRLNFTQIDSFDYILLKYLYEDSTKEVSVQLYNYNNLEWDTKAELQATEDYINHPNILIYNSPDYIEDGLVQLRFYQSGTGNQNYYLSLDLAVLNKGAVALTTNQHNSLAGLQGGIVGQYYHLSQAVHSYLIANINDFLTPTTALDYFYNKTQSDAKFVPYTGATQNVDFGGYNLTANSGTFSSLYSDTYNNALGTSSIAWNGGNAWEIDASQAFKAGYLAAGDNPSFSGGERVNAQEGSYYAYLVDEYSNFAGKFSDGSNTLTVCDGTNAISTSETISGGTFYDGTLSINSGNINNGVAAYFNNPSDASGTFGDTYMAYLGSPWESALFTSSGASVYVNDGTYAVKALGQGIYTDSGITATGQINSGNIKATTSGANFIQTESFNFFGILPVPMLSGYNAVTSPNNLFFIKNGAYLVGVDSDPKFNFANPVAPFNYGELAFLKATSVWRFTIGGITAFDLSSTTADFQNRAITTTGNITGARFRAGANAGVTDTYDDGLDTQITFTGGIATAISTAYDERLMENITYIGADCDTQLCPINFYWNEDGLKQFSNPEEKLKLQIGYKAQDVQLYYPNCTTQTKRKEIIEKEEIYSVQYDEEELVRVNKTEIKTKEISWEEAFEEKQYPIMETISTTCYNYDLTTYNCLRQVPTGEYETRLILKEEVKFDIYSGKYTLTYREIIEVDELMNVTKSRDETRLIKEQIETDDEAITYNKNCLSAKQEASKQEKIESKVGIFEEIYTKSRVPSATGEFFNFFNSSIYNKTTHFAYKIVNGREVLDAETRWVGVEGYLACDHKCTILASQTDKFKDYMDCKRNC